MSCSKTMNILNSITSWPHHIKNHPFALARLTSKILPFCKYVTVQIFNKIKYQQTNNIVKSFMPE